MKKIVLIFISVFLMSSCMTEKRAYKKIKNNYNQTQELLRKYPKLSDTLKLKDTITIYVPEYINEGVSNLSDSLYVDSLLDEFELVASNYYKKRNYGWDVNIQDSLSVDTMKREFVVKRKTMSSLQCEIRKLKKQLRKRVYKDTILIEETDSTYLKIELNNGNVGWLFKINKDTVHHYRNKTITKFIEPKDKSKTKWWHWLIIGFIIGVFTVMLIKIL